MKKRITCFFCYLSPVAQTQSLCLFAQDAKNFYQEHDELQQKQQNELQIKQIRMPQGTNHMAQVVSIEIVLRFRFRVYDFNLVSVPAQI